jgi:carboxyl-terminal processing protease
MTRGRTLAAVGIGLALGVAAALALPSAWRALLPARAAAQGADGGGAAQAAAAKPGPLATLEAALPPAEARRLAEILGRVRREYVDEIPPERLLDEAARGMVASLDPHSAYLDRREFEDIRRGAAGSYPGIGIEVVADGESIKVLRPIDDSPAWRAGIRAGDIILRIDGSSVRGDVAAAIEQMRGPAGSLVHLMLRRAGSREVVEVALERTRVEVHSVSGMLLDERHGYLRIANFSETTAADFDGHVAELRKLAPGLRGVVIDLRDNPGGVLEAAVAVADSLLERGIIVTGTGRTADARFRMDARPGQSLAGVDIVVLVNRGSASSAEILAGALKDNGRARLLGARTYGKGSVQSVIPLSDGRALKITTSRYATPSGTLIQERGIDPDLQVAAAPRFDEPHLDAGVKAALQELRQMWDLHRRDGLPEPRTAGVRPPRA